MVRIGSQRNRGPGGEVSPPPMNNCRGRRRPQPRRRGALDRADSHDRPEYRPDFPSLAAARQWLRPFFHGYHTAPRDRRAAMAEPSLAIRRRPAAREQPAAVALPVRASKGPHRLRLAG